ncbi:M56 family metallopeptidase [Mucilaginibacter terrae]|uniref:Beta-lactamase regulating signal transducer with metallopeptidase domain n=1 Tax=Mucilaginibacter terrae TaxID=1955052 RepID=A0ABU3GZ47_9SPHI|nr:M56 family metallopeptidase [Mucilaginibacter terrae]MDT3405042.1 beta-lactamase regulating signal transducer with metallopeptidase domain [Mucilaginibacter terrae]
MINLLQYLLEVNVYLALAYGGYWLLLRRQTFHSANRAYLLASALLCFAIPLVQISFARPAPVPVTQVLTQAVFTEVMQMATPAPQPQAIFEPFRAITALYIAGAILGFVLLCAKLYRLLKLIFTSQREQRDGYTLVFVPGTLSPFSFMRFLFAADEEQLQPVILKHELVHITQKHSYDVLFTELLKIICWFNPAVYLLQNSLKALHEFEADRLTAEKTEQDGYVDFLIAQACQNNGLSFANHFSEKQLLKSRIMKLYQKRSGSLARLNYLMALPLCAGMLCASSAAFSKDYGFKFEWGKTPKNNLTSTSITTYETVNNFQSGKIIFPPPTIRTADGKVISKPTAGFEAVITPESTSTKKDSVKKMRLKVTSGNTSTITDQLKLNGAGGKQLIYTAQTLTKKDRKDLKQKFGINVETTNASNSATSILVLPPPPPIDPRNPNKVRRPLLPPPPPPVEKPASQKRKDDIPPPPPPVDNTENSTKTKKASAFNMNQKHYIGTVFMGITPEPGKFITSFEPDMYVRPQLVYIQIDKLKPENIKNHEPVKHGDHSWFLIKGKLYDALALEKLSARISTKEKLGTLLHAKSTFYHKPNDAATIKRFGESVGKNGVTEFVNVVWSRI